MTPVDLIAMIAIGGLVFAACAVVGFVVMQRTARRRADLRERVGMTPPRSETKAGRVVSLFRDGREIEATLPGMQQKGGLTKILADIETCMQTARMPMSAYAVIGLFVGAAFLSFVLVFMFTGHPIGSLVGAGVVLFGMQTVIKGRAKKQSAKFDDQLVEALGLVARSLRAGHTVNSGLKLAAEESDEPVRSVFLEIVQQQEFGVGLEESLRRVAAAHPSNDLKLFAASVAIQVRAGGNLAETTSRLADVIRERLRLARRVRVLIAQTQMSKQVLLGLPVVVFGLLNIINPDYVDPMYTTPTGQLMLSIAVGGLLVGSWVMNKMAVLKY
ncbi:MAG: hypothetical protein CMJ31_01210 [Phycisphaerae bacterium]|nr:hypothetical protein [Phycisphaerae bacterium]